MARMGRSLAGEFMRSIAVGLSVGGHLTGWQPEDRIAALVTRRETEFSGEPLPATAYKTTTARPACRPHAGSGHARRGSFRRAVDRPAQAMGGLGPLATRALPRCQRSRDVRPANANRANQARCDRNRTSTGILAGHHDTGQTRPRRPSATADSGLFSGTAARSLVSSGPSWSERGAKT